MATIVGKITIDVECRRYMLVFFPFATYMKLDDVAKLTVLGIPVYCRAGACRSLLGYSWTRE